METPMATFNPPKYTWNAITAHEAYLALDAARDLIDAHLSSFTGERLQRVSAAKSAPVAMRLELDLTDLVGLIGQPAPVGDDSDDDAPGYPS
jgi:hypothetical protein